MDYIPVRPNISDPELVKQTHAPPGGSHPAYFHKGGPVSGDPSVIQSQIPYSGNVQPKQAKGFFSEHKFAIVVATIILCIIIVALYVYLTRKGGKKKKKSKEEHGSADGKHPDPGGTKGPPADADLEELHRLRDMRRAAAAAAFAAGQSQSHNPQVARAPQQKPSTGGTPARTSAAQAPAARAPPQKNRGNPQVPAAAPPQAPVQAQAQPTDATAGDRRTGARASPEKIEGMEELTESLREEERAAGGG